MQYLMTFLEGLMSFISPCMLPMLPVYVSYFAASDEKAARTHVFFRVLSFVLGFTIVFCMLGVFAGTVGRFLKGHSMAVNVVCGVLVVLFGLAYMEVIPLPFLKGMQSSRRAGSIVSAFVFGVVFSVSLTPCVGAFLGAALMAASASGTALQGLVLLLFYSLGLGVPFLVSAVLIDRLKGLFGFIKGNYRIVNRVCGGFLIVVGLLMAFGLMDRLHRLIPV